MKNTIVTLLKILASVLSVMLPCSAGAETRLFVPQFSYGPQQDTQLLLMNGNNHDSTVDLWAFTSEGQLAGQFQVTVARNSTRSLTLGETFQLSDAVSGWMGAVSKDDRITMSYSLVADRRTAGYGKSYDAVDWTARFFHETLADTKRQVIRIANPNDFPAQVILNGLDQAGSVVARHDVTVPAFAQFESPVEELLGTNSARLDMRANADVVPGIGQKSSLTRRTGRKPVAGNASQQLGLVIDTPGVLGAYQVVLRFDPAAIQLNEEDVAGGIAEGFESRPLVVNINNAAGEITLASFQVGANPAGRVTVARINVSTKGAAEPRFLVHVQEVTDSTGTSLFPTDVAVALVRLK